MPFQGWLAATYDSPKDVKMAFPFFSILLRCRLHVTSLHSLIRIFFLSEPYCSWAFRPELDFTKLLQDSRMLHRCREQHLFPRLAACVSWGYRFPVALDQRLYYLHAC